MANTAGEMPFLDHLEELRKRLFLSLAAIIAGFCAGWWITTRFKLIKILEAPGTGRPAFAPPILKAGRLLIAQTPNILMYLG